LNNSKAQRERQQQLQRKHCALNERAREADTFSESERESTREALTILFDLPVVVVAVLALILFFLLLLLLPLLLLFLLKPKGCG